MTRLLSAYRGVALLFALLLAASAQGQTVGPSQTAPNIIGWSNGSVATNTTFYLTTTTGGANQNFAMMSPQPGTFRNLYMRVASAPGAGQSYVYTLYVGAAASMVATSVTCTISGASATSCNDTADTAAIAAGQSWAIQIVTSVSSAATGQQQTGIELDAQ